ncbi:hypothetical protein DPMN_171270 [Dreissena polymorpha]|uniref:Uncharacterized protein n=1 Tax=Dreissena polymorpha TaxID=45954 RepID=A0A9D4DXP3_DREPO|nr:hypothetical protein DPMN_171270 [Dreissena polymorpha]
MGTRQDIIGTYILTKFHGVWTTNVASRLWDKCFNQDLSAIKTSRVNAKQKLTTDNEPNVIIRAHREHIFAHLRGLLNNLDKECLRNVNARVFTNQMWTDGGQRPTLKPHLSNQQKNMTSRVFTRKTAPPTPGGRSGPFSNSSEI